MQEIKARWFARRDKYRSPITPRKPQKGPLGFGPGEGGIGKHFNRRILSKLRGHLFYPPLAVYGDGPGLKTCLPPAVDLVSFLIFVGGLLCITLFLQAGEILDLDLMLAVCEP